MATGKVKWFDEKKGFGFIVQDGIEGDIFVHFSSIKGDGFKTLKEGEGVEFEVGDGPKGKQAKDVKRIGGGSAPAGEAPREQRPRRDRQRAD